MHSSFVQLDVYCSGDAFLRFVDECIQVMVQGFVDQSHVGKFRPLVIDDVFELQFCSGQDQLIEIFVCRNKDGGCRVFIVFSGFQTKNTVFDHVVSSNTVVSGKFIQLDNQFDAGHFFAV